MGRECEVSGKKTSFGNHKTERGKAKYLGGVGKKTTGISAAARSSRTSSGFTCGCPMARHAMSAWPRR